MTRISVVGRLVARAVLLAGLWWVLTDGSFYNWGIGLGFLLLATALTWWLSPPVRPAALSLRRAGAAVALVGWFLWRSAVGGLDVARRAVTRVPDTDPEYVEHRLRLPDGPARVAVMYLNNLMPGSLSVEADGDVLHIHAIAAELPALEQVTELEERVARVAGHDLRRRPEAPGSGPR